MCCVQGSLYTPLVALVIGRDVFLVTGTFALRMRSLGWKWPGWQEFFRTTGFSGEPSPAISRHPLVQHSVPKLLPDTLIRHVL